MEGALLQFGLLHVGSFIMGLKEICNNSTNNLTMVIIHTQMEVKILINPRQVYTRYNAFSGYYYICCGFINNIFLRREAASRAYDLQ